MPPKKRGRSSSSAKKRTASAANRAVKQPDVAVDPGVAADIRVVGEHNLDLIAPDNDGYFRFRKGRVKPQNTAFNTFVLLPLVLIGFGNNTYMMFVFNLMQRAGVMSTVDWGNWKHVLGVCIVSSIFTSIVYHLACSYVYNAYYIKLRHRWREWKVQTAWPTEEQLWWGTLSGCVNAATGSAVGMLIFAYQQRPSTTPGTVKIYYTLQDPLYPSLTTYGGGWPWFFASAVIFFVVADFWAYAAHRTLHLPFLYTRIHKFHHYFNAPFPHVAWASHPVEFFMISIGVQFIVFFLPIHIVPLMVNLLYVGMLAIKDHSGVAYIGWFEWSASSLWHDYGHHVLFHRNFGQSLYAFDYHLGGAYRKGMKAGEKNFKL